MAYVDQIWPRLQACRDYMHRFGLWDCAATRRELADVLDIPLRQVETFALYGRLGVSAQTDYLL